MQDSQTGLDGQLLGVKVVAPRSGSLRSMKATLDVVRMAEAESAIRLLRHECPEIDSVASKLRGKDSNFQPAG